jgi:glycosyltransferase involved in cell wall biosynthesis
VYSDLISVIMPVYNAEKYLDKSIQSIINQTYKNFEFIIIDDGSTDNSLIIINQFSNNDQRIIVITRENKGLVFSLNEGISRAKGKYIARMDADDISILNRFELQVDYLESNNDVIACGGQLTTFSDENSKINKVSYPTSIIQSNARLLFSVSIAHPAAMMKRSVLSEIMTDDGYIYDEKYKCIEDYDLWSRLIKYGSFNNLNEVVLKYRIDNNGMSCIGENNKDDRYSKSIEIFSRVLRYINFSFTDIESKIHFDLAYTPRIRSSHFRQEDFLNYIDKLIKYIQSSNILSAFDKNALRRLLFKKILTVIFIKKEILYWKLSRKNVFFAFAYFITNKLSFI